MHLLEVKHLPRYSMSSKRWARDECSRWTFEFQTHQNDSGVLLDMDHCHRLSAFVHSTDHFGVNVSQRHTLHWNSKPADHPQAMVYR